MIWLAAVGGGSFVLVSFVLGPRLLLLARRTGLLPELTMGLCLLLMGGFGYPLAPVARVATPLSDEWRGFFLGCAVLCNTIGFSALAIFNWRTFRPESRLAAAVVAALLLVLGLLLPAEGVWPGLIEGALSVEAYPGLPGNLRVVLGLVALYWAFGEALLCVVRLRRRLALGLADPVVTDRLGLWAISMGSASLNFSIAYVMSFLGVDLPASPLGAGTIGILGVTSSVTAWLAFLPPQAYVRRVRARYAAVSAPAA